MLLQLFAVRLHFERDFIKKDKLGFKIRAPQAEKDYSEECDGTNGLSKWLN